MIEIDTATDYADLLDRLVTFATANGWTELENTSDKVVLQGEGSGTDEIFVAIQKYANVGTDAYGWRLNGYTGYQDGELFRDQPGAISETQVAGYGMVATPLWDSTIPYWFIVSGRRIIVIAKVSTTYQVAYLGFNLPFASPNQFPYPLCVGGSFIGTSATTEPRWSGTGTNSSAFWSALHVAGDVGSLLVRIAGGSWYSKANAAAPSVGMYPYNQADIGNMRQAIDGDPVLTPVEFHQNLTTPIVDHGRVGELDGVYHVSGFGVSAEDVVTIGDDDYLIVPNVFRSSAVDYAAIKLV